MRGKSAREGDALGAVDTVLAVRPPDDAGAQTADRYDWQASMAAADGLGAYIQYYFGDLKRLDTSEIRFICEYHEDWLIQLGPNVELVSAKHREQASGPWKSIMSLVSDGGIGHLFGRWLSLRRSPSVRLVTNSAIASGEATDLVACCGSLPDSVGSEGGNPGRHRLEQSVDKLCRAIMMYRKGLPEEWCAADRSRAQDQTIPEDLAQAARAFLLVLRIDQQRPSRQLVRHAAPSLYAQPLLTRLGQCDSLSTSVWEAVVQIFRLRMRAQGPTQCGKLPTVGLNRQTVTMEQGLEDRTVTLQDIRLAIDAAIAHPAAFFPVQRPRRLTKLGIKMAQGLCSSTSIERAERLRLDYSNYRRDRRNSVPGSSADFRLIEKTLHRIADEETHKIDRDAHPYGSDLWAALSARLADTPQELSHLGLDGDLCLGGIGDLASRCHIWFSNYFDINTMMAKLRSDQDRGGSR